MHNKKIYKIATGVCLILAILIGLLSKPSKAAITGGGVMSINGVSVPEEEFSMFLQDEKALTVSYFTSKYQAEYETDFWTADYQGEKPLEVAKQNALDKLTKIKIEQQVAKELGIISESDFDSIIELMQKDKSIYGAENLDIFQKYSVFHSKLVLESKGKFKLKEANVSEKQIEKKYEEVKETMFIAPDDIDAVKLEIAIGPGANEQEVLDGIAKDIGEGIAIEDLRQRYKERCQIVPESKIYGMEEGKDENMSELDILLKEEAYKLNENEMTYPLQYGENYYMMVCLNREDKGEAPLEEVRVIVEDMIKEEAYEAYINAKVNQVQIIIDEKAYNNFTMR